MWHSVAGGESGWAIPDPTDNNIVWASGTGFGSVGGTVERFDERTRQAREVEIWPESTVGTPAGDVKYRFNWTFPRRASRRTITTPSMPGASSCTGRPTAARRWQVISPDLTLNDQSRQQRSGGLTPDNIGVEYAGVVFAIAESPREKGVIWAGTNDGQVQVTRDAGGRWTNVTANIPGLPPWGTVSNIEPSRFDNGTAYVTFDLHQVNNRDPFVFKTTDYGQTWRSIAGDIPKSVHSYAHCVREDPVKRGLLYLGTENALYFSPDDGQHWLPLQSGLPHAPVHWLTIQEHFNDLVVATYGRGFYILDDITPLRTLTPEALNEAAHLFAPRPTYRFRTITDPMMMPDDATEGRNPPYGAADQVLAEGRAAQDDGARHDEDRDQRRRGQGGADDGGRQGGDGRRQPGLVGSAERSTDRRSRCGRSPLHAPEFALGPDGTRKFPTGGPLSVLVPPGTYTVKLVAGGAERTAPLDVRKDPNTVGTEADIAAQTKVLLQIRDNVNVVAKAINDGRVRSVRSSIALAGVIATAKPRRWC